MVFRRQALSRFWQVIAAAAFAFAGRLATAEVVLLVNGNVLHGKVTLVSGQYRVAGQGSEIRLRPADVSHVGDSIHAVYAWKRNTLSNPSIDDRLKLAAWCTREKMFAEAAREILDARAHDPEHPGLAAAEQRLQQAWKMSISVQASQRAVEAAIDKRLAGTAEAAKQLRLMKSLPGGTLEHFTRRIQPILVNNCTTSGCHRTGGEQSFQLSRNLLHGQGDRRSTFANLASVLAALDREQIESSPLLMACAAPHGGNAMGILSGSRSDLHDQVTRWAYAVVNPAGMDRPVARPTTPRATGFASMIGGNFQPSGQPTQRSPGTHRSAQPPYYPVKPATFEQPAMPKDVAEKTPASKAVEAPPRTSPAATPPARQASEAVSPRDEFDPEVFNRRFR